MDSGSGASRQFWKIWVEFWHQGQMLTFWEIHPNLSSNLSVIQSSINYHSVNRSKDVSVYPKYIDIIVISLIYELYYESHIMIFSFIIFQYTFYINHLKNVNRISSQKEVITHQATDHNQRKNCVLHFQMNID